MVAAPVALAAGQPTTLDVARVVSTRWTRVGRDPEGRPVMMMEITLEIGEPAE